VWDGNPRHALEKFLEMLSLLIPADQDDLHVLTRLVRMTKVCMCIIILRLAAAISTTIITTITTSITITIIIITTITLVIINIITCFAVS
jgi:hypothetical protein